MKALLVLHPILQLKYYIWTTDASSGNAETFYTSDTSKTGELSSSSYYGDITIDLDEYTCNANHSIYLLTYVKDYTLYCNPDSEAYNNYTGVSFHTICVPANDSMKIISDATLYKNTSSNYNNAKLDVYVITTQNSVKFRTISKTCYSGYVCKSKIVAQFIAI